MLLLFGVHQAWAMLDPASERNSIKTLLPFCTNSLAVKEIMSEVRTASGTDPKKKRRLSFADEYGY